MVEYIKKELALEIAEMYRYSPHLDKDMALRAVINGIENIPNAMPMAECQKCAEKTNDCIVKLQEQIEQMKRERDAAVADLEPFDRCKVCTYNKLDFYIEPCASCRIKDGKLSGWEWRGVQDEFD